MGQENFMSEADKELSSLIWNNVTNETYPKGLISSREQISFSSPKTAVSQENRKLSIFLYNITEQKTARNPPANSDALANRATYPQFTLHYLVTPLTGSDERDHELLQKIVNAVLNSPSIDTKDGSAALLKIEIDSLSLDQLSKLWSAIGAPLRFSIALTVSFSSEPHHNSQGQASSATVAAQTSTPDTEKVAQLYQAVFETFKEQTSGWRSRNMMIKQWLFQEFTKKTNMTVDEMLIALSNLGERLKQHGSTAQFIEPLNKLAGFYSHQLDELKGLHRVSRSQQENLEMVSVWIKDIDDLVKKLE